MPKYKQYVYQQCREEEIGDIDPDELVTAGNVWSEQLFKSVAEAAAAEDHLFEMVRVECKNAWHGFWVLLGGRKQGLCLSRESGGDCECIRSRRIWERTLGWWIHSDLNARHSVCEMCYTCAVRMDCKEILTVCRLM